MQNLQDLEGEIWKDINDYVGLYQISNMGRIKSLKRYRNSPKNNKKFKISVNERIISPGYSKYGYNRATLSINNIKKTFSPHRLVAEHFIPNPENRPQVNHINGITNDNRQSNLHWCTQSENCIHAYKHLNRKNSKGMKGKLGKLNKLSKKVFQFTIDGVLLNIFDGANEAARITGFTCGCISSAALGKHKLRYGYRWSYTDKPNPL